MKKDLLFNEFPVLESDKVVLKKITEADIDELYEIYSNEKVFEYCGIIPKKNKETVKNMIKHFERDFNKKDRVKWGIYSGELLGIVEAFNFNQKVDMVTIGYFLSEKNWNKGVASEAVKVLVKYLFEVVDVNRIHAEVMPQNENSKKVLIKNNFTKEGLLREANFWPGKGIIDIEVFSILKGEYKG